MSAKKAPAKKAAKKQAKRAPKTPKSVPVVAEHLLVPVTPGDWPSDLDTDTADKLFAAVEEGQTVKQAAEGLKLKGSTVYQWKRRHPAFGARLEEAIDVGIDMMADEEVEKADKATDRDSAAAVKVQMEARANYRRFKRPQRFNVNPFKATDPNADDGEFLGVVIVPAKRAPMTLAEQRPAIEGEAVPVAESAKPPRPVGKAFRLTADGY